MASLQTEIADTLLTGDELLTIPDPGPCELIKGRMVPMSPTGSKHGFIEANITFYLKVFVRNKKLGWVLSGEAGVYTERAPDTVRGADVLFISKQRHPEKPEKGFLDIPPELVVEVISPTDSRRELETKKNEYFDAGVKWVWIVDPSSRTCTVYRSKTEKQVLRETDKLVGEDILAGLEIEVRSMFEE